MSMFVKATKQQAKARVALDGPTGAGKTWNALVWGTTLGKKVALIDTERGSASLYAPHFEFDTLAMSPPYEPQRLVDAIRAAEAEGYDVVVIDSLSHFWEGEGGTLDMVDGAAQRSGGNSFAGWKVGTPALRHLVDTMLGCDMHLIATMRSKMEYVLEEDGRGKKVPRKIGMAPVMRAGVEYEFTLVGELDLEHRLTISKSRCDVLADQVIQKDRIGEAADTFRSWLNDGEPTASRNDIDAIRARIKALGPHGPQMWNQAREEAGLPETVRLLASQVALANRIIDGLIGPEDPGPGGGGNPPPATPRPDTPPRPDDGTASTGTDGDPGVQPGDAGGSPPAEPGQYKPGEEPFDRVHHLSEVASIKDRRDLDAAWHAVGHEGRVAMDTRWAREVRTPIGALTVDQLPLAWSYVRMGRALDVMYQAGVKTEAQRHALVREATDGRTESTKDLTDDDIVRLSLRASLVKAKRLVFTGRGKSARWAEPEAVGA